jgi:hypothetical protein
VDARHKAGHDHQENGKRVRLKLSDKLRYRLTENSVLLDKTTANEANDPFANLLRMVE